MTILDAASLRDNGSFFTGTPVKILEVQISNPEQDHMYSVQVHGEVEVNAAAAATTQHMLIVTHDGTEPGPSHGQLMGRAVIFQNPLQEVPTDVNVFGLLPAANGQDNYRIALYSYRPIGTPSCRWVASDDRPVLMLARHEGPYVEGVW